MADSIYSTDIQVWVDLLNANWAKIEQIIANRARTPSQLELVDTMTEFHTLLVNYRQDGVDKMQRATVNAFVKKIDVDLRRIIDDVSAFLVTAREAEQVRANNETARETAEDDRDSAETTRRNNEITRQSQEGVRVGQESDRQTAEATRVTNWNNFFGATANAGVRKTWSDWFSDTLATGVRSLWNNFWTSINSSWNGFWGTNETDPNGVRKQWADLHSQATSDHTQATTDHTDALAATAGANDAAALANTKAQYAETQGDRGKGYNDHPWEIRNDGYIYVWDETTEQMVRTNKMIIDFEDLTEEQKEELIRTFYESLVFASQQTCMDIIDELQ